MKSEMQQLPTGPRTHIRTTWPDESVKVYILNGTEWTRMDGSEGMEPEELYDAIVDFDIMWEPSP